MGFLLVYGPLISLQVLSSGGFESPSGGVLLFNPHCSIPPKCGTFPRSLLCMFDVLNIAGRLIC